MSRSTPDQTQEDDDCPSVETLVAFMRSVGEDMAKDIFAVWEVGGEFMPLKGRVDGLLQGVAKKITEDRGEEVELQLYMAGHSAYVEKYAALLASWDSKVMYQLAAEDRAPGRRRANGYRVPVRRNNSGCR